MAFEYSTRHGFKEMKVVDGTRCFSRAGTVLFMPPADFAPMEVEGVRRWWLRLRGSEHAEDGYHPQIRKIFLNAVDVRNQQTQPEEEFYVEITAPNMTFQLGARNILSAEVFVSEFGQLSHQQMRQMLEQSPQDVRVEYDLLGEITGFFVRWTEVESFDGSQPGDRHYMLDRMRGTLMFGDGVHVRIPQAQTGIAISVRAVSCDGSAGNVPARAINRFFGNILYVQSVYNPQATYAGSDLEDLEGAWRRGADLLSGRGRLISEIDFTRAVRAFSKTIKKVKCLAGRDLEGQPDHRLVTIAVMTEDYDRGAGAFRNIQYGLRQFLMSGARPPWRRSAWSWPNPCMWRSPWWCGCRQRAPKGPLRSRRRSWITSAASLIPWNTAATAAGRSGCCPLRGSCGCSCSPCVFPGMWSGSLPLPGMWTAGASMRAPWTSCLSCPLPLASTGSTRSISNSESVPGRSCYAGQHQSQ